MASRQRTRMGRRLRALREAAKLTHTELAATIGVTAAFIQNMEAARRPVPKDLAQRLALALGLDPAELLK
jgi:transcriptional regulator with XRE-family HTH domain